MLRRIPLGQMCNLRDLGGYPIGGGQCTAFGRILRGDNPAALSEDDLRWLLDRDITTIIDLRSEGELGRSPDALRDLTDFHYIHIPLVGGEKLPNLEDDIGLGYFKLMDCKADIRQVLECIAAAPGGVLYHCTAGKDRTGVISALLLSIAGVGRGDILADYEVSETYLWDVVSKLRADHPDMPAFWGCSKRGYMKNCLERVDETYGSVSDYLGEVGLTEAQLAHIRGKLLKNAI